jgi:hypothetical protein
LGDAMKSKQAKKKKQFSLIWLQLSSFYFVDSDRETKILLREYHLPEIWRQSEYFNNANEKLQIADMKDIITATFKFIYLLNDKIWMQ